MIQSMTGFGKVTTELSNKKISVEIKSLNSKQLDLSTRIPNAYRDKEIEIRSLLSQTIERGKVDFLIYLDNVDTNIASRINPVAFETYYNQIWETADRIGLELPMDWFSVILRLPEAVKTEIGELDESEWLLVKKAIMAALNALVAFRVQEGTMLETVFKTKIATIAKLLQEIDRYEAERIEKIKTRLNESIRKLDITSYDENRFEQEMIYYIERLDVSEEKSRLDNHLKYFLETMWRCRKLSFR